MPEMDESLYQLFRDCTVLLTALSERGTGFFVAPGQILTCAHVVKGADASAIEVRWRGEKYTTESVQWLENPDLALLRVTILNHPCVYLDREAQPGHKLYSYGYPDLNRDGSSITVECEGPSDNGQLITIKDENVRPGLSGAPLLNQHTMKVCGIIKSERSCQAINKVLRALGGQAIPTAVIFAQWPELEEKNQDFHQLDKRWVSRLSFVEALDSDWEYLNFTKQRIGNYLKVFMFLAYAILAWLFLGLFAEYAFPFKSAKALLRGCLFGKLGEEVKHQREQLQEFKVSPSFKMTGEAKKLNLIDSKSWMLIEVIELLSSSNLSSDITCRLFWTIEELEEQRYIILELKRYQKNQFFWLTRVQSIINYLENFTKRKAEKELKKVEFILNKLIVNHINFCVYLDMEIKNTLDFFMQISKNNPKLIFYLHRFSENLLQLFANAENVIEIVSQQTLEAFDEDLKNNPRLKVLYKFRLLLSWVSEKKPLSNLDLQPISNDLDILILGGPIRAWRTRAVYHFNRNCKLYPERVKPEDKNKIIWYQTREEAEQDKRAPCKRCLELETSKINKLNE